MIYLDTSAYLSVLFDEKDAPALRRSMKGHELCTSILMFLEAERNVVHYARLGKITNSIFERAMERIQQDIDGFYVRDITSDLLFAKAFPPVATPKTADLIHLRTALWFSRKKNLIAFVTTDLQQLKAARELGLPVM